MTAIFYIVMGYALAVSTAGVLAMWRKRHADRLRHRPYDGGCIHSATTCPLCEISRAEP